MQICRVSAPSQQFIKFLTGGLHLKINVSYTKTTVNRLMNLDSCFKKLSTNYPTLGYALRIVQEQRGKHNNLAFGGST